MQKDYAPETSKKQTDENLNWLLDELLKLAKSTHPHSKQASCVWLLAVIKGSGDKEPIRQKLQQIQDVFMDLLCENNGKLQRCEYKKSSLQLQYFSAYSLVQFDKIMKRYSVFSVKRTEEDAHIFKRLKNYYVVFHCLILVDGSIHFRINHYIERLI